MSYLLMHVLFFRLLLLHVFTGAVVFASVGLVRERGRHRPIFRRDQLRYGHGFP